MLGESQSVKWPDSLPGVVWLRLTWTPPQYFNYDPLV